MNVLHTASATPSGGRNSHPENRPCANGTRGDIDVKVQVA